MHEGTDAARRSSALGPVRTSQRDAVVPVRLRIIIHAASRRRAGVEEAGGIVRMPLHYVPAADPTDEAA